MRTTWRDLGPSLFVAVGIVLATLVSTVLDGWLVLAGPVLMAAVLAANVWDARMKGRSGPSAVAMILAGTCILSGGIIALSDPADVKLMIPTLGVVAWVAMFPPFGARHKTCRGA